MQSIKYFLLSIIVDFFKPISLLEPLIIKWSSEIEHLKIKNNLGGGSIDIETFQITEYNVYINGPHQFLKDDPLCYDVHVEFNDRSSRRRTIVIKLYQNRIDTNLFSKIKEGENNTVMRDSIEADMIDTRVKEKIPKILLIYENKKSGFMEIGNIQFDPHHDSLLLRHIDIFSLRGLLLVVIMIFCLVFAFGLLGRKYNQ